MPAVAGVQNLYTILKDMGRDITLSRGTDDGITTVPPKYALYVDDSNSPVNSISGMFFTHTRFKHLQNRLGITQSVGVQMPWQMRFMVVKLNEAILSGAILKKLAKIRMPTAQEMRDSEKRIQDASEQMAYVQQLLARFPDPQSTLPATQQQIASLQQQWRNHKAELDSAQRLIQAAHNYSDQRTAYEEMLQQAIDQRYISNFTFRFVESFKTYKQKSSTGVKAKGSVELTATSDRFITVSLKWHEDHWVGRGGEWFGSINVGCDNQGRIHLDGDGAFWQRYLEANGQFG